MKAIHLLNKLKGFTLAEVLITLAIIGVVAALTIPVLSANILKKKIETRLVSSYSNIEQALMLAEDKDGDMSQWLAAYTGFSKSSTHASDAASSFVSHILPYINANYDTSHTFKELGYQTDWRYQDGTVLVPKTQKIKVIEMANGSNIIVTVSTLSTGDGEKIIYKASWFVDVNGAAGPNKLESDIHQMDLLVGSPMPLHMAGLYEWSCYTIYPNPLTWEIKEMDYNTLKSYCYNPSNKSNGVHCGALIQKNNWKVPKDYPYLK